MPDILPVVCTECARQKQLIESAGDVNVLSCDPDPARPGICLLIYETDFGGSSVTKAVAKKSAAKKTSGTSTGASGRLPANATRKPSKKPGAK